MPRRLASFSCLLFATLFMFVMAYQLTICFFLQVAADSGDLGLDGVYELIEQGESLPVCLKKELEVANHIFLQLSMSVIF